MRYTKIRWVWHSNVQWNRKKRYAEATLLIDNLCYMCYMSVLQFVDV